MARIESPDRPAPFAVGDRIVGNRGPGVVTRVEWAKYRQWGHPGWDVSIQFDANPRLPWVSLDGSGLMPEDERDVDFAAMRNVEAMLSTYLSPEDAARASNDVVAKLRLGGFVISRSGSTDSEGR